jgi:hypothetical protein
MSLNPSAEGRSLYDALEGSVTSYFNRLAGVLQRNESVNGMYKTTVTSSYGANTPFKVPGFGRVCISSNGATVVDMANSFITMKLEFTLKFAKDVPKSGGCLPDCRTLFVGWKNSLEALERYDIYVDSTKIYSQTWVGEESFIYNAGMSQSVRERNPWSYTSWKNVKEMDNSVCGVYIHLNNDDAAIPAGTEFKVEIPVKINLHQILMLSSVRYLPSFCGRWEIELYPHWKNMVVATVPPEVSYKRKHHAATDAGIWQSLPNLPNWKHITESFTQIGRKFNTIGSIDVNMTKQIGAVKNAAQGAGIVEPVQNVASNLTTVDDQVLIGVDGQCLECLCSTTTFLLRYEVYESLRQKYAQEILIIPTNTLQYSRFSGQPGGTGDGTTFHATLSQNLENCDSIFILIPFEYGQHTCFYQPYLREVRMQLGEFGIHPQQAIKTWNEPRFVGMLTDALNLEVSEITGMNDDTLRTFTDRIQAFSITAGAGTVTKVELSEDYGDMSNFFIGISLSQIGFQSGTVTSPNAHVPFIFDAVLDRGNGRDSTPLIDSSIVCMFLLDCALMIQVVPDSDIPVVKLSSKSIV